MRLGADPEVFLLNKHLSLVSCVGKVKGNKWSPMQIADLPKGFTLQQDNVALEFGIPPAASKKEFINHILTVKKYGKMYLTGLSFSAQSSAVFPKEEMQTAEANYFGCEPDFNAWTGKENPKPVPPDKFFRSAGGHIHIETRLNKEKVVRACDLFMGVMSVIEDQDGKERRVLYGGPGAYRPKPYGVEYRTLSNYWIFDEHYIGLMWDRALKAVQWVADGKDVQDKRVHDAIQTSDLDKALQVVADYGLQ